MVFQVTLVSTYTKNKHVDITPYVRGHEISKREHIVTTIFHLLAPKFHLCHEMTYIQSHTCRHTPSYVYIIHTDICYQKFWGVLPKNPPCYWGNFGFLSRFSVSLIKKKLRTDLGGSLGTILLEFKTPFTPIPTPTLANPGQASGRSQQLSGGGTWKRGRKTYILDLGTERFDKQPHSKKEAASENKLKSRENQRKLPNLHFGQNSKERENNRKR